jgi:hypothetical protein
VHRVLTFLKTEWSVILVPEMHCKNHNASRPLVYKLFLLLITRQLGTNQTVYFIQNVYVNVLFVCRMLGELSRTIMESFHYRTTLPKWQQYTHSFQNEFFLNEINGHLWHLVNSYKIMWHITGESYLDNCTKTLYYRSTLSWSYFGPASCINCECRFMNHWNDFLKKINQRVGYRIQ